MTVRRPRLGDSLTPVSCCFAQAELLHTLAPTCVSISLPDTSSDLRLNAPIECGEIVEGDSSLWIGVDNLSQEHDRDSILLADECHRVGVQLRCANGLQHRFLGAQVKDRRPRERALDMFLKLLCGKRCECRVGIGGEVNESNSAILLEFHPWGNRDQDGVGAAPEEE